MTKTITLNPEYDYDKQCWIYADTSYMDNEQTYLAHTLKDLEDKSYSGIFKFLIFIGYSHLEAASHAEFYSMFFSK